ncbi:type II toxin-antitoxin system Y4mF family antitoxin [Glaciimonas sp. GG7]
MDEQVTGTTIRSVEDMGILIQRARKEQGLTQLDISGLAHTGNRFIVELEKGKPTIQMQKALEVLELLGLELIVRKRGVK